ncbi:hypothetical protein WR25_19221 isoform D [Diploscapter pachys]|uniref:Zinc carboxypeptidase A 1 n=2 Tax=Diploscapter pachys TaxID=2018661 RepID=A0A2A2KRL0_9BILA|nr:hypothetical protein WR25_19221 isoform D [Diploscapter pachys]
MQWVIISINLLVGLVIALPFDKQDVKIDRSDTNLTKKDEGAFKVYRIVPSTNKQLLQMIHLFENALSDEADFWHPPSTVNQTIDVMVAPEHTEDFSYFLDKHNYKYKVAIEDLKKLLIEKESKIEINRFLNDSRDFVRLNDDAGGFVSRLRMGEYYSYNVLVTWMNRIAEHLPNLAQTVDIGGTTEGRRIIGIKFGRDAPDKKIVVIDAGIHSREWTAIHTASYFINLIVNSRETDSQIASYLDHLVIYIFPVLNPDGYEFTRTERTNPRARMWRKSRSLEDCRFDGIENACCKGVDLNRNFGFRWGEIGSSHYPCSETYHGKSAFSEPESKALADFLTSLKGRLTGYITLHAYSQLWIYSYSHRKNTYAPDIADTRRVAEKAVAKLSSLYGTKFNYGTGPEIIYAFSGGSTDWAKETLKVQYSYTIELRPTYEDWNGFVLDRNELVPTAKETWEGVKVVLDEIEGTWRTSKAREVELNRIRETKCFDRLPSCQLWLRQTPTICQSSSSTMLRDCARSCHLCHMITIS